ncbi:cytochrome c oxidase assembly protein COX11, mitochondrial-like protein [Cladochytrium replicatum]|nr:cytochrome c oxidase assembly protein COX11, mitochondrial-like protein [Cladochytrium replicatum]
MTLVDRFPNLLTRLQSNGVARLLRIPQRSSYSASQHPIRTFPGDVSTAVPPTNPQYSGLTHAQRFRKQKSENFMAVVNYTASVIVVFVDVAYAAVPLYKIICTQTGSMAHHSQQRKIKVLPGKTAPEFYTAKNSSADVVGISTYSVVPPKAAQYFNKIQCFCFEEQKLEAGEEVDMPVFFYIDPKFLEDPWMASS